MHPTADTTDLKYDGGVGRRVMPGAGRYCVRVGRNALGCYMTSEGMMKTPTQAELAAQYGGKPVREVFEFTLTPDTEYGAVDWETLTMLYGPHYRLEEAALGVRVTVMAAVPKAAVIAALKQVLEVLELTDTLGERRPSQLESIVRWFNG